MKSDLKPVSNVLFLALTLNILVATAKLVYGIMSGTLSMVADGIHSFSDAASSVMALVAVRIASRPSDADHHYGHDKFETLAALGVGAFIGLTSWEILKNAVERLMHNKTAEFHYAGIGIMVVSVVINASLSWYERKKGEQYKSAVLKADAYHTGSDIAVSLSVFVSLFALKAGIQWVDPILSLLLVLYFLRVAYKLIRENVLVLSDAAFIEPAVIRDIALATPGVISCHRIRTRGRIGNAFVDLHIQIDAKMPTAKSHQIAHNIEAQIKERIEGVQDVLIHTEPYPDHDDD